MGRPMWTASMQLVGFDHWTLCLAPLGARQSAVARIVGFAVPGRRTSIGAGHSARHMESEEGNTSV